MVKNSEQVDVAKLVEQTLEDMDRLFEVSQNRDYTQYDSSQTFGLIEHYQGKSMDKAFETAKHKVQTQYNNFLNSEFYCGLWAAMDRAQGVFVEPIEPDFDKMKFYINWLPSIPIWAQADFAMISDGIYTIYDWKTGRLPSYDANHISKQLKIYALKTLTKLGFEKFDNIDIVCQEVYLKDQDLAMFGGNIDSIEQIKDTQEFVKKSIQKLTSMLKDNDPIENIPKSIDRFEKTSNQSKCQSCRYIKQCRELEEYL